MKFKNTAVLALALTSLLACHKDDKKSQYPDPPGSIAPPVGPMIAPGLTGEFTVAGIAWVLPKYLEGKLDRYGFSTSEAAFEIDLTGVGEKKTSRLNSGFTTKFCSPVSEAEAFIAPQRVATADNIPDSLKTDVDEISSWTAESKNFKGRAYLKKRYKSEGDTGIYRVDVLLADELNYRCVLWNFTLTPEDGVNTDFIENSSEYLEMTESLVQTWKGLGLSFND